MMLKPLSTIGLLLVLTSIIWGAQSLIKSFKSPKSSPTMNEGIALFQNPQLLQANQFSAPSFLPSKMQAIPVQVAPPLPMPNMQTTQANFYNPQLQNYSRSNG